MAFGVEGQAHRCEGGGAELLEHAKQFPLDQLDTRGHGGRARLVLRRQERPIEVVQHRQQLANEGLVGEADVVLPLADRPLTGIVELGHEPEILVLKALRLPGLGLERRLQTLDLLLLRDLGGQHRAHLGLLLLVRCLVAHDTKKL